MDSSFTPRIIQPWLIRRKVWLGKHPTYLCGKKTLVTTLQMEISQDLQMQHTLFSLAQKI
jgi:hypothetical protein